MVSRFRLPYALLALGLGVPSLSGCETARTEVLVVVDSDLGVPSELDSLIVDVIGPDARRQRSTATLDAATGLPRSLGVVHTTGPLGPFQVTVTGRQAGAEVLTRQARVSFEKGRTLVLPMHLVRSCLATDCAAGQTCTEDGCRAIDVTPGDLERWSGEVPGLGGASPPPAGDASVPDAG